MLKENPEPATDTCIVIASVNAARHPPLLSHRFLPWESDLNRCFGFAANHQDDLARDIVRSLKNKSVEAVIDAHNTSAHSEPFAVSVRNTKTIHQLTPMFTKNLIVMDQSLNTLIEHGDDETPWLTIEFGGVMDPNADELAYEALKTFITASDLFAEPVRPLRLINDPLRLEIDEDAHLHYSSSVVDEGDITMFDTIDQLNFHVIETGTALGWLGPGGLGMFRIRTGVGTQEVDKYFQNKDGFLTTKKPMTIFMATTDPYIARKDCLLYFSDDD